MMDMFSLASIASAFFVVAVSPGPANLANATLAMNRGRGASLVYGAGLSTGLAFWGVIAAGGLGVVLQQSLYLMTGLKILGGLYLIWLALVSGAGVCVVVGFAVNALYSIVFSFAGMMQAYRRAKRWIDGLAAGLFAVAGVGLFRSAWCR